MGIAGRTAGRRWATTALVSALFLPAGAFTPAAVAAEPANWWFDTYDIDAVHAAGWTGKGVPVAVIDVAINPELPVFAGSNLTVADGALCAEAESAATTTADVGSVHGTTVTAVIAGNGTGAGAIRGIAPGADVTFYGSGADESTCSVPEHPEELTTFGWGLQRAIDDGARIVSYSRGFLSPNSGDMDVVANALAKGVVLVDSTPNAPEDAYEYTPYPWSMNGVVAVAAVDANGSLQATRDAGTVVIPGTTVVAAGADFPTVGVEGEGWDASRRTTGSSFSAPLVAGMLAIVAQRYPEATGNQLIQSLIHNTGVAEHPLEFDADGGYGYGAAWLTHMLEVDPTQYPDVNPLMDKSSGEPTAEQVAAAAERGFALPDYTRDSFGQYEDADPAGTAAPPAPGDGGAPTLLVVAGVVLAVVVVGGIVLTVILVNTRKKTTPQGGPS